MTTVTMRSVLIDNESMPMALKFKDKTTVATCLVRFSEGKRRDQICREEFAGSSMTNAASLWVDHLSAEHAKDYINKQ